MKTRCFIAIDLPEETKQELLAIQKEFKKKFYSVKWTSYEAFHLTVKFLGEIDANNISQVIEKTREIANSNAAFSLQIKTLGAFPHTKKPRVVWAGVQGDTQTLETIQKQIHKEFVHLHSDNRFHPHITLGRVKEHHKDISYVNLFEKYQNQGFGETQVQELILFESKLLSSGPVYTPLEKFSFKVEPLI